jgi:hypothetical protein
MNLQITSNFKLQMTKRQKRLHTSTQEPPPTANTETPHCIHIKRKGVKMFLTPLQHVKGALSIKI